MLLSIPVAHALGIIESDDSMKQLLQYIKYDTYKWNIVIALLLECSVGTLNFLVSCVSGTAGTRHTLCQKDTACQKKFGARTQKCKASFTV